MAHGAASFLERIPRGGPRQPRPSAPTRPSGSQSRARAQRPLRASVRPASARRARRLLPQAGEGRRRGKRHPASSPRCRSLLRPAARHPKPVPADPRSPAPVPHLRRAPAPGAPPGPAVYTGSDVCGRPRPRPRRPLRFPRPEPTLPSCWLGGGGEARRFLHASKPSRHPVGGLGCVLVDLSLKLTTETLIARQHT